MVYFYLYFWRLSSVIRDILGHLLECLSFAGTGVLLWHAPPPVPRSAARRCDGVCRWGTSRCFRCPSCLCVAASRARRSAPVRQQITAAEWRREKNRAVCVRQSRRRSSATFPPRSLFVVVFLFFLFFFFSPPAFTHRPTVPLGGSWAPVDIWSEVMEVAPACLSLLCVCLLGSLAADWEFVDTNFTYLDDVIDYKDPCKAGTVHFSSLSPLPILLIFWLFPLVYI